MDNENLQVVGIGTAVIDYLGIVNKMPMFNDLEAVKVQKWKLTGGGPVATALVALSRFGVRTGYIGMLGDDLIGYHIRDFLEHEGVDVRCIRHNPELRSPTTFVLVEAGTGRRAFLSFRDDLPDYQLSGLEYELIRSARFLHLDGQHFEIGILAAQTAKDAGVRVCLDAYKVDQQTPKWISVTDVVIAAETFPASYTGEQDLLKASRAILKQGPSIVVTTLSERGCSLVTQQDQQQIPGFDVNVVDTTGAGDVFHGAFIYGLLQGWDSYHTALFANAAGALKCQKFAGWTGIPTLEEVDTFLGLRTEKYSSWAKEKGKSK
jgi:sulfofructose kinase